MAETTAKTIALIKAFGKDKRPESHICTSDEYDQSTLTPTVAEPNEKTIYMVPGSSEASSNLFTEWIWTGEEWEMFGSVSMDDIPVESGTGAGSVQTKTFTSGNNTYVQVASGFASFAEGSSTVASGHQSHAEGNSSCASAQGSHAEGVSTLASGIGSHSEGMSTAAVGSGSHAEGGASLAVGPNSHAEGGTPVSPQIALSGNAGATTYTYEVISGRTFTPSDKMYVKASKSAAKVVSIDQSNNTITLAKTLGALDRESVLCLYGYADSARSHVEGNGTIAESTDQHVQGKFNVVDNSTTYADIVGNGTGLNARSNAYALDWSGNARYAGDVYVGANADSTGGTMLPRDVQINGTSIVSNGVANVPLANSSTFGVAKVNDSYGIYMSVSGTTLAVSSANGGQVKNGLSIYKAITPSIQHESVFYGLAKAAGDSTQSASDNAVGTYTAGAKTAIQSMLGVPSSANVPVESGTGVGSMQTKVFMHESTTHTQTASGEGSFAHGADTVASGYRTHAEGQNTTAAGGNSHAEGYGTRAGGYNSHAEGKSTTASGDYSHSEGENSIASGKRAHAEGNYTIASQNNQHTSGKFNVEDANWSSFSEWAANTSYSVGDKVKRTITENNSTTTYGYRCMIANNDAEFTASKWEKLVFFLDIIGNGTADNARANAHAVDLNGNVKCAGDIYVGCNADSTGGTKLVNGLKVVRLI